jgi:uncharacterized protein
MKTLPEIRAISRAHTDELRERYGVTGLAVFGSAVRGEAHEGSDIDILADFSEPIGMFELCAAQNRLCDILGAEVDLIPRRSIRPENREQILHEAVGV